MVKKKIPKSLLSFLEKKKKKNFFFRYFTIDLSLTGKKYFY